MPQERGEPISERFARLLALYRRPDGSGWGGQDIEDASGGTVTRSYVANLRKGRIENPGLSKLEAIAGAMGFPPALWFGEEDRFAGEALLATLWDPTVGAIVEEVVGLGRRDRELLLGVARGISSSLKGGAGGSA